MKRKSYLFPFHNYNNYFAYTILLLNNFSQIVNKYTFIYICVPTGTHFYTGQSTSRLCHPLTVMFQSKSFSDRYEFSYLIN